MHLGVFAIGVLVTASTEGCVPPAKKRLHASLGMLDAQLERARPEGPYCPGAFISAVDIYSVAVIDALALLPDVDCPMKPSHRSAFSAKV